MIYAVSLTREALEDLQRVENFLIDTALEHGDLDLPERALAAIRSEFHILERIRSPAELPSMTGRSENL